MIEWSRAVPEAASKITPHNYNFTSAYLQTAGTAPYGKRFTFCTRPDCSQDGLDQVSSYHFTFSAHVPFSVHFSFSVHVSFCTQVWYTQSSLKCVALRALFLSDEQRRSFLTSGLPCPTMPSDHIPVGAAFKWRTHEPSTTDACPSGGACASRAVDEGGDHTLPNLQPDVSGAGLKGSSGSEAALSANEHTRIATELLAACPFASAEHRAEFDAVTAIDPSTAIKGKPSAEDIARMKSIRERKERCVMMRCAPCRALPICAPGLEKSACVLVHPH
jgi:hypothetical protein